MAYSPNCEIDVPSLQVAQMQGDIVELERRRTAEHREVQFTHAGIIELIEKTNTRQTQRQRQRRTQRQRGGRLSTER